MATKGVNKVILLGNIGSKPAELRYTTKGNAMLNARLATNERWRDKQTGTLQDQAEWHRLVFFGPLAEIASEYLQKGSKCYIEGKLRTRKWQDTGIDRFTTEIIVNEMVLLDKGAGAPYKQDSHDTTQTIKKSPHNTEIEEDDIPF